VRQVIHDPVFEGLPDEFEVMESHCGQIEWPPAGWELIVGAGTGTLTKNQCLKVKGRCIYAAQFHIEMQGTEETSRRIMSNFLSLAKQWVDSHSDGK
jgi:GMP synthase-like glutamine amidotransferase